jgi:4-alpha-glucanotransferase
MCWGEADLAMNSRAPGFTAPFAPSYRASGVLLHVTSLPSRYGIGDVGPAAIAWIDRLADAGQSWWQVLPLGSTGFGHSPYQALSSFTANLLVISPDRLIEDGLLDAADCQCDSFPADHVDFERVIPFKQRILARAWQNFQKGSRADLKSEFNHFCQEKAALQEDPAIFMALRAKFRDTPFTDWPQALSRHEPTAIARAKLELTDQIEQFRFGQFILLRQWLFLKDYANRRGIQLLGDLPIFVSPDSSDVWANPELYLLDNQSKPKVVAGVPPDYFSADGQLWGNPLYDWDAHRQTGYRWWITRLQSRLEYLDAIRIDHFRAFEAAWHIPAGSPTAASGRWVTGPGADFFDKVRVSLGRLPLLAEDLGIITPAVTALRNQFHLPGMRVLQFAFDGDPGNPHLPHHCAHNGVVYTGTHDNNTSRGWYDAAGENERKNLWRYVKRAPGQPHEAVWELIRLALSSDAALAIVPLQDLLALGSEARMNTPGRADGQWRWRCTDAALDAPAWDEFRQLTQATRRDERHKS